MSDNISQLEVNDVFNEHQLIHEPVDDFIINWFDLNLGIHELELNKLQEEEHLHQILSKT